MAEHPSLQTIEIGHEAACHLNDLPADERAATEAARDLHAVAEAVINGTEGS